MVTIIRLARVALTLLLALFALSFILGIATTATGWVEKAVLLMLVAGCVYLAAKVATLSTWLQERLHGH